MLDDLGVRWAIVGALAANRWRTVDRFTTDIDFLVDHVDAATVRFEELGYTARAMTDRGEAEPFLVLLRGGGPAVDLIRSVVGFQESALERAVDGFITAEDVIVHKLIAWRPKDQDDVRSILEAGHDLDHRYIEGFAADWEVLDRWVEAKGWSA